VRSDWSLNGTYRFFLGSGALTLAWKKLEASEIQVFSHWHRPLLREPAVLVVGHTLVGAGEMRTVSHRHIDLSQVDIVFGTSNYTSKDR
jgi:hypothetical protein